MKFTDKEISELRKIALLKNKKSIFDEYVYIAGERLEFMEQELEPPGIRVMLPKTYLDLPLEFAKKMYPSEKRPELIKTSPSLNVHFSFTHFKEAIKMNEVATCSRYYLAMMKKLYPGNQYLENSEHFIDGDGTRVLGWYSFANPTLEGQNYNIHAFTNLEGRVLYGTFLTSQKESYEEWKPFVFEVFNSIRPGREKGGMMA